MAKARQRPELTGVSTTFSASQQQLYLDLDRSRTEILGVPVIDRFRDPAGLLRLVLSSAQFTQFGRIWQVIIQARPAVPGQAGCFFHKIYAALQQRPDGPPFGLITARYVSGPNLMTRFNGFPAAKVTGSQAPGYSTGQAIAAMEAVAREVLPGATTFPGPARPMKRKNPAAPPRPPLSSA